MPETLSDRALSRATLARQALLERSDHGALAMVEHLVGLQAQAPDAPYVGLWTRLRTFDAAELAAMVVDRRVVRLTLMRGTVHLVSAADALALHPRLQPMLARRFASTAFARRLHGVPLDEVVAEGRRLLAEATLTRSELGRRLADRWPGRDPASLAYAVDSLTPAPQVPPRGVWGSGGGVALASLEGWLGRPVGEPMPLASLVVRYLAAFGPASVRDVQAWCGLTRLGEVIERLGPRLRRFRDESGRELFDLPDAPRPHPDTPAPPRFLPAYDNLLLSHADRSRVIPDGRPVPLLPGNGSRRGTLLLDGRFAATWAIEVHDGRATLSIETFGDPAGTAAALEDGALAEEGERLLRFVAPDAHALEMTHADTRARRRPRRA